MSDQKEAAFEQFLARQGYKADSITHSWLHLVRAGSSTQDLQGPAGPEAQGDEPRVARTCTRVGPPVATKRLRIVRVSVGLWEGSSAGFAGFADLKRDFLARVLLFRVKAPPQGGSGP